MKCFCNQSLLHRFVLVLVLFCAGFIITAYLQIQSQNKNYKYKNSDHSLSSCPSALNKAERSTQSFAKFIFSGHGYADIFRKNNSTSDLSSKNNTPESIETILEKHLLLNISNVNIDKVPSMYQKMLKRPIPYPNCGVNSKMQPWSVLSENVDMLFLIKSAPQNIKLRNFIRKSWTSISSVRNMTFASIFVVAYPTNDHPNASDKNELLLEENQIFGDMLQCEFQDSYRSLPIKVLSMFRWVLMNCVTAVHYTITDDDCLMDLENIVTYFHERKNEDVVYCGFEYDEHAIPFRNQGDKLYISLETFSPTFFPTFCHGPMYTMRGNMMKNLYMMAELTDRHDFHLEDVYITGILREKFGFGDKNIQPVLTKDNKMFPIMYFPYTDVHKIILAKHPQAWQNLNAKLPWASINETAPLMTVLKRNVDTDQVKSITSKWEQLK